MQVKVLGICFRTKENDLFFWSTDPDYSTIIRELIQIFRKSVWPNINYWQAIVLFLA